MDESHSSARKLIASWQAPSQAQVDTLESPDAVRAIAWGGGLFGLLAGGVVGILLGFNLGFGGVIIIGIVGAFVGAVGCALLGVVVGLVGQWIVGRFQFKRGSRANLWDRLVYAGLVGAVGGPPIHLTLRGVGLGIPGLVGTIVGGLLLWMMLGLIGTVIEVAVMYWRKPPQ